MQDVIAELRPALLRIARMQLRNDAWAEDVVSETLLSALEGSASFDGRSQVKTWLVGILRHKIIDCFRRGRREVSVDARMDALQLESLDELYDATGHMVEPPSDWGDPEAALSRAEFFDLLQACIDKLPRSQGRVFMMREWLEFDTDEICRELGILSGNCFVMLHRARLRLRECLEISGVNRLGGCV